MSRRRGKAFRVRSRRSTRTLKRYWNDVRAISDARGVRIQTARSLYRAAVSGHGVVRSEVTRKDVVGRVGSYLRRIGREEPVRDSRGRFVKKISVPPPSVPVLLPPPPPEVAWTLLFDRTPPGEPPAVFNVGDPLNKDEIKAGYEDTVIQKGEGRASILIVKNVEADEKAKTQTISVTWEYEISGGLHAYLGGYWAAVREACYRGEHGDGKSPETEGYYAETLEVR